jgi:ribosomal protein S18
MLLLIICNKEYLIDIILTHLQALSIELSIKTLVAIELPQTYDFYDGIIIHEDNLKDPKIISIFSQIDIPSIIIKQKGNSLNNKLSANDNIYPLQQPIDNQELEKIMHQILSKQKLQQHPYINFSQNLNKQEERFNYALNELNNSKEDLSQLQQEIKLFYGTINNSIQKLEDTLNAHNQQLLDSTNKIHNSILKSKTYGSMNDSPEEIFEAKREEQLFKNSFTINFKQINEDNYKDLEILLSRFVKEETLILNRDILREHCLIIIQLIYHYLQNILYYSTKNQDNPPHTPLLFELIRSTVGGVAHFVITIKKTQGCWSLDEFIFLYRYYIYTPILNMNKQKLTFSWIA